MAQLLVTPLLSTEVKFFPKLDLNLKYLGYLMQSTHCQVIKKKSNLVGKRLRKLTEGLRGKELFMCVSYIKEYKLHSDSSEYKFRKPS